VEPPFGIRHFGSGLDRTHWTEDGEISDSDDDDDLPSFRQILARPKRVIDLTSDDDGLAEVSWLRNTRTARHRVRLTPASLTDRSPVADQPPSPPTAFPAKITGTHCRRRHNLVYSGHIRQEETPLGQPPSIVPQTSTAFRRTARRYGQPWVTFKRVRASAEGL
jgi:hypothetical protein